MEEFVTDSLSLPAFETIARNIAKTVRRQDVVALSGDLGAGKTTFSRAFIRTFLPTEGEITSPTFNLVQLYSTPDFDIWHFDLYRLKYAEELTELGLEDALESGVSLIEWPEIAKQVLPNERLEIFIENGKNNDERRLRLHYSNHWKDRIHALFKL
ncbi:MAG: tRNA (adenosine(37)-N6)-threonylcarbamoyltransferase complex ATPase subunit type 1 TsaE [Proteobacteria bacterium]|nr:tRNA (adenosine(37)-N6)-threonylcarbamoyltransferase complex ATPase subunit type 1 TsaE [Pseudomonadota bacterium]